MSRQERVLSGHSVIALGGADEMSVAILAVGDSKEWLRQGNPLPMDGSVHFVSIEDVTDVLMSRLCPSVVLSPALTDRFDCIDLAMILHGIEFKGRYRAISGELPNPRMVENEIRQLCPGLDFGILVDA